jgi:hypothetical protein
MDSALVVVSFDPWIRSGRAVDSYYCVGSVRSVYLFVALRMGRASRDLALSTMTTGPSSHGV